MAEANEGKRVESNREMATINTSLFPRDLLLSFMPASAEPDDDDEDDEEDGGKVELNLGLSLGGRFGIDKTGSSSSIGLKKLTRSSSIVGTMPIFREDTAAEETTEKEAEKTESRPSTASRSKGLTRTTSLPVETEEEWRRRKEMQTLRRMAAKRRRNEKIKNSKITEDSGSGRGRTTAGSSSSPGLPRWSAEVNKSGFLQQQTGDSRQGSVESQGGSSGAGGSLSEFESRPPQASRHNSEESTQGATMSNRLRRLSSVDMNTQGKGKNEMPCVFTKGEGPNGRRVDGILYRYGKGAEVRIMCVCHGTFWSPAEFVKHAGGGDVDHPLRHIVVNTSSSSAVM